MSDKQEGGGGTIMPAPFHHASDLMESNKEMRCRVCGSARLVELGDGLLRCDDCGEEYESFEEKEENNFMPIVVTAKESTGAQFPDGMHEGAIVALEERNVTFADGKTGVYIDFHIEAKGQKIKWGCSNKLTPKSKLAQTLSNFQQWKIGDQIDLEKVFVGKKITFMTLKKGDWSNIVDNSIRPVA